MTRSDQASFRVPRTFRLALLPATLWALGGCGVQPTVDEDTGGGVRFAEATVNPIEFMRNTSPYPTLWTGAGGTGSPVSFYEEGNRFWYVKTTNGLQWERYSWDGTYINLERDTSWPLADGRGNDAYDCLPYGSLHWARSYNWATGTANAISYSTTIVGFNYDGGQGTTCQYDWQKAFQYSTSNTKWLEYYPAKCWGGDIGCVDSIAIPYNNGTEKHWYARGLGWVAWEYSGTNPNLRSVYWKYRSTARYTPAKQCGNLGFWSAPFINTSTQRNGSGDWDFCRGKANCAPGESLSGISEAPNGYGRIALCQVRGTGNFGGAVRATLTTDAGDARRAARLGDWAPSHFKLECGLGEYVMGTSENSASCQGNNRFHAIQCAAGSGLGNTCYTRNFDVSDSRGTASSGDWDFANYKGECGLRQYVAGVSVNPTTGRPHSLLCCY